MSTPTQDYSAIIKRLEKTERDTKHMGWFLSLLLMFLGLALLRLEFGRPNHIVEAGGFLVKDENGVVRARLGSFGGDSSLYLYDSNGDSQVYLSATPHGPLLTFDIDEHPGGILRVGRGNTFLFLYDTEAEKPRVQLSVTQDGPSLSLQDANGQTRVVLKQATQEGKEAAILFYDENGHALHTIPSPPSPP